MPVFAILAHDQPQMLALLAESLFPHKVVVHLDAKADERSFSEMPNVTFTTQRVAVNWGGLSVVAATNLAFRAVLDIVEPNDHVVLLSGQCFPVRPLASFAEYLRTSSWRQHCQAALVFDGTTYSEQRLRRKWYFDAIPLRRASRLRKLKSALRLALTHASRKKSASDFGRFQPVAGSQWIALTRECLEDLLPIAESADYGLMFRHALAPDEMYFHTLVYNSKWRHETSTPVFEPRAMRGTSSFANFHFIDPTLTRQPDLSDLQQIRLSGAYFTRKLSLPESKPLIEELQRCIA
jgi:hypothetical protein